MAKKKTVGRGLAPRRKTKKKAAPKKKASPKKRDPKKLITIGVTPPWLAEDSDASKLLNLVAKNDTRPSPEDLSKFTWMSQDRAYQVGWYLMTHGLHEHANHPELEICNVPGWFVPAAGDVLNELASYILNESPLKHGESFKTNNGPYDTFISFREIAPGTSGTEHDFPVLRVLFMV
jgi:hypothetical protein